MAGYDVTQHLSYRIPAASAAGEAPALGELHVQVIGGVGGSPAVLPAVEDVSAAILRRGGVIKSGQRFRADDGSSSVASFMAVCFCDLPEGGRFTEATKVKIAPNILPVLRRCHILPFSDAQPVNRNLTINDYIRPFFESNSCTRITKDFEFARDGCRFKVVGCEPEHPSVVGPDTEVYWQGEALRRTLLKKVAVLPYRHTLPEGAQPNLFQDYVRPLFEQRSAGLMPGDEFESRGVRFRVVKCHPPGGGPAKDTEVHTDGPALVACAVPECGGLATQRCQHEGCGKVLCKKHTSSTTLCPEHAPSQCILM